MSTIPTKVTQDEFERHFLPHLNTARRGFVSRIPLHKIFNYILYRLHTGCQWEQLPIAPDPLNADKKEISHHAVYHHFRKWSRDASLEKAWLASIIEVQDEMNLSEMSVDGSHAIAKKGGAGVSYQGRKKAKTSNLLSICEGHGYVIACLGLRPGHHHDAFGIKPALQSAFKSLKALGLKITGALFHADPAFDTKAARKTCFNHGLVPNIKENPRARKNVKRGRKRFFDETAYKRRFVAERSFAWSDKFKSLLVRFEREDAYSLGAHHIAFALINLRHRLNNCFN
jgi:transposase